MDINSNDFLDSTTKKADEKQIEKNYFTIMAKLHSVKQSNKVMFQLKKN